MRWFELNDFDTIELLKTNDMHNFLFVNFSTI